MPSSPLLIPRKMTRPRPITAVVKPSMVMPALFTRCTTTRIFYLFIAGSEARFSNDKKSFHITLAKWYIHFNGYLHQVFRKFQFHVERPMIKQLKNLLDQMAKELPGVLAAAVVTVADGMSIAEVQRREHIDTAAAAAYLASIVKSNAKAINLLADDEEVEDILITTRHYHFIIRHIDDQPFFIFVMTSKQEWLAKARLLIKKYEPQFVGFAEYFKNNFQ